MKNQSATNSSERSQGASPRRGDEPLSELDDDGPLPGLGDLKLDCAPERDLWPGIEARLAPRSAPWRRTLSYAAAAVLVLGLSVNLLLSLAPSSPEPVGTAPVSVSASAESTFRPMRRNDPNRQLVRANLKIVDDAERQLQQALRTAPDSDSLRRLLDSTRQQRRDLRRLLSRAA